MKVLLDTNVLLSALPQASVTYLIFLRFIQGAYTLCLTTDILEEYEEVFGKRANAEVAARAFPKVKVIGSQEFLEMMEQETAG